MRIGFVGLGAMGRPMALHLLERGHELAVYARRPEAAAPLLAAGARACASPAEAAREAEFFVTMVTGPEDFEEVVLGSEGAIRGAPRGCVVVDMETIPPATVRRVGRALAEKGIELLDAPVSGGPAGAEQATLSIMVGGSRAAFERARPLFECLGRTIVYMGESGAGQATKACNQLALLVAAEGVAESLALAQRCGLDPARVREVMLGGIAASRVLELFGARMIRREFGNGIEARLYHKDLRIVLELAHEAGQPAPAAAVVMQHLNAMVGAGAARADLSALITVLERMSAR